MKTFHSVKIPDKVSPGDEVKAADHNALIDAMRSVLATLPNITVKSGADIGVKPGNHGGTVLFLKRRPRTPAPELHPFKIIVQTEEETIKCYVNYGQVFESWLRTWNTYPSDSDNQSQLVTVSIGSGALKNHPAGTAAGHIALSASYTYGIWLTGGYTTTGTSSDFFSSDATGRGYDKVDGYPLYLNNIIASADYVDPGDKPDNGRVWLYIGKVTVDSDGIPEIVQWQKSDIILPFFMMPWVQPSTDSPNGLILGNDGLPFVDTTDLTNP